MESNDTPTPMTSDRPRRFARVRGWALLALPVIVGGAAAAANAHAFGPHGRGFSPERMQAMIEKRVDRMLDRVDATDDQKVRIKNALARTKPELIALATERTKLREAAHKALSADQVDGNEVERLRRETMQLAERGSTLISRTLVEVSQVLNPAQRKELLEAWQGGGRGRGH